MAFGVLWRWRGGVKNDSRVSEAQRVALLRSINRTERERCLSRTTAPSAIRAT